MRLFSYVVTVDAGFAPNPYHDFCTLATCKPKIRKTASVGDWIIGTGSKMRGLQNCLIYAMRVTEEMTFSAYWADQRFRRKRPDIHGNRVQVCGDNIYFRKKDGSWHQELSLHDRHQIYHDTRTDRVLVSDDYVYWGGDGPEIPERFRNYGDEDIRKKGPAHKSRFSPGLVRDFLEWIRSLGVSGLVGEPFDQTKEPTCAREKPQDCAGKNPDPAPPKC